MRPVREREGGFTVIELALAMLLFSIIVYASLSLVKTTTSTMTRVLGEFNSRKRVLMLQREMAEGTAHYAGYLAASKVSFRPGSGELTGSCEFYFEYPDYDDWTKTPTPSVTYVWWPDRETIEQSTSSDGGQFKVLLGNVAGFSVTKKPGDSYTLRVEISHRVKGFSNPIVRATEGQARNMARNAQALADALEVCP